MLSQFLEAVVQSLANFTPRPPPIVREWAPQPEPGAYSNTSVLPDDMVKQAMELVWQHTHIARQAEVVVKTTKKKINSIAGFAEHDPLRAPKGKITITVPETINESDRYPLNSCYRKSVGTVCFNSVFEEFLHVFAHECRHIDQFFARNYPPQSEVDAEAFAVEITSINRGLKYDEAVTTLQVGEATGVRTVRARRPCTLEPAIWVALAK